uniref:AlNc14C491G11920 protein n=1 Tax=Albugo laibachii Nc14 TaxID=890382 RepID=F0X0H6_9STRA|nr:AlNc14C491G11920 [Albugo laibachii Nc14]|eukprot:CCA27266.1 AlNc14C491G11920 [Albugo laibachii Nc14]
MQCEHVIIRVVLDERELLFDRHSHRKNDDYQSRAKHIDVLYHFVRDQVREGEIQLKYVDSKEQVADFLTKPLSTKQFNKLARQANIRNCLPRRSVEDVISESDMTPYDTDDDVIIIKPISKLHVAFRQSTRSYVYLLGSHV